MLTRSVPVWRSMALSLWAASLHDRRSADGLNLHPRRARRPGGVGRRLRPECRRLQSRQTLPRRDRAHWGRVAVGESPAAFRRPSTRSTVAPAAAEPTCCAGRSITPPARIVRRGMGDPGRRFQGSRSGASGGGGCPRPGAGSATIRRLGAAADAPVRQHRALSRSPRAFDGQRGVERVHASQPAPTPLRRRPAERVLTAELRAPALRR